MRIACVHVPQLALQAVLRRDPEHRDAAVALADGPGERARVVALTEAARRLGVRPGLTVSQARAVAGAMSVGGNGAPALAVVPVSAADSAAAVAALLDVAYAFAPRVESEGERVFLDVSDLRQLFPHGERAIAQAIAAQAARVGLAVQVGIAGAKPVARAVAMAHEVMVVAPGDERPALASIPLALALAGAPGVDRAGREALNEKLNRWGMRTLGALAALPAAEVTLRLGARGTWLHRLSNGSADEAFAPRLPPDALEEGTELDWAIHELEPLAFVLRGLIDRALARLGCRGLACAGLTLRLKLDPRGYDVREIPLGAPTREGATLLQLARLDLARRPPSAPVVGADILVRPARVRGAQLDLWRPAGPAPEKLAATLARLGALVGPENVGAPALVDSHREEAVSLRPFELRPGGPGRGASAESAGVPGAQSAGRGPSAPSAGRGAVPELAPCEPVADATSAEQTATLGFRRFRPPQPLEVILERDGPAAVRGRALAARIMVAAGPYRLSGEWWSEEAFSRDYWDVQASDGAVYRLHQDRRSGSWFLDGYYD